MTYSINFVVLVLCIYVLDICDYVTVKNLSK